MAADSPLSVPRPHAGAPAPSSTPSPAPELSVPRPHTGAPPRPVPPRPGPAKAPRPVSYAGCLVQELPAFPSRSALRALTQRELPETDGRPLPESMYQHPTIHYTVSALGRWFRRRRPESYVAGELLVYSEGREEADGWVRAEWVVPDVLVAFGVGGHRRHSYVLWQEGKAPEFVLEVASGSTWRRDRDEKPAVYAGLGVREYFLYDPVGRWLEPRLQGYGLEGGRYRRLEAERLGGGGEWGLRSRELGLWAWAKGAGGELRWGDPETGRELEDYDELHDSRDEEVAARRTAEARLGEEAVARRAAEIRLGTAEARLGEEAAARRAAESQLGEEAVAHRTTRARFEEEVAARDARIAELEARLRSGS